MLASIIEPCDIGQGPKYQSDSDKKRGGPKAASLDHLWTELRYSAFNSS